MMNESKGNMYGFVTHTWNPIKGECIHKCEYCYMKRWGEQKPVRLVNKELDTNLGEDNFIFVGSSTDMFSHNIPLSWIRNVLGLCNKYSKNKYLFQTKNPIRLLGNENMFPKDTVWATTIETNRPGFEYEAPPVLYRKKFISMSKFPVMITIEPIMDFDLEIMVDWIKQISPFQVAIGADSQKHNLPEPNRRKVLKLTDSIEPFTTVILKPNLKRIMGDAL